MTFKSNGVDTIIDGTRCVPKTKVRGDFTRLKIWSTLLRAGKPIDTQALSDQSGCSHFQCKSWLEVWMRAGYVTRTEVDFIPTGGRRFEFMLTVPSDAPPQLDINGKPKAVEHKQYVWEVMREYGSADTYFKPQDIIDVLKERHGIDVDYDYLISYLRSLFKAKYLWGVLAHTPYPMYLFKVDTGPIAPSICRGKKVFDPNLEVIVN